MDITYISPTEGKISEKLDFEETFEENLEDNKEMNKQSPLFHILEKQAKELEEFGRRMTLELQSSYIINKQQNEQNEQNEVEHDVVCHECKEKTELINTLRARIDELEDDAKDKKEDIKKLQSDVRSLFDIIVKRGQNQKPVEKTNIPAKITITTEIDGAVNEVDDDDDMYYNDNNIKDSYSDSAVDLFTDDDDYSSTNGGSVRSDDEDYVGRPSEWLDVSPAYKQRAKIDKRNLDRWNSKMASNGLLPIRLVGKVDAEKEKKYQTHRKGYSTSAIWLKTYENTRKKLEKQSQEEKFKLPSFSFSFKSTEDTKKKESQGTSAPISLKSSVSTSVSELTTCSITTTSLASNTLKPYDMFHKDHKININGNSSRLLSQYK